MFGKKSTNQSAPSEHEIISQDLENGNYFKDAMAWYYSTYIAPINERSFLIILSICTIIIAYTIFASVQNMLPLKQITPIMINTNHDSATLFPIVSRLDEKFEPIQSADEAVARYLLIKYLQERESYTEIDLEKFNNKLQKIKFNSSKRAYRQFQMELKNAAEDGFIKNFGKKDVSKEIKITSFKFNRQIEKKSLFSKDIFFSKLHSLPKTAIIQYETTFNDKNSKKPPQIKKYSALVNFNLKKVRVKQRDKLRLQVINLKISER